MEESNLLEYIKSFIDELKKKIILITFTFLLISIVSSYFLINNQTEFSGQISIKKITNSDFEEISQINQLLLTAQRSELNTKYFFQS